MMSAGTTRKSANGVHRLTRILPGDAFVASFTPPEWLIHGIVQCGRLYACTSRTGHGKTAVWLFNACMIQAGRKIGPLDVMQGNVLILAGENPEDLKARMIGLALEYNIPNEDLPYVLPYAFPMTQEEADALRVEIHNLAIPFVLIVGDTAASFFPGEDENDNVATGDYARTLRSFTEVDGAPAVVVLSHPVKNAAKDNLLPRGGGAFLNELDGNLTLWSEEQGEDALLHWQGKIRGPDFPKLGYRLRTVPTGFFDQRGNPVLTVIAEPISEEDAAAQTHEALAHEDIVLLAIRDHPDWSQVAIARFAGWFDTDGQPYKMRVGRVIARLLEDKLLEQTRKRGKYVLTPRGEKALQEYTNR